MQHFFLICASENCVFQNESLTTQSYQFSFSEFCVVQLEILLFPPITVGFLNSLLAFCSTYRGVCFGVSKTFKFVQVDKNPLWSLIQVVDSFLKLGFKCCLFQMVFVNPVWVLKCITLSAHFKLLVKTVLLSKFAIVGFLKECFVCSTPLVPLISLDGFWAISRFKFCEPPCALWIKIRLPCFTLIAPVLQID